MRTWAIDCTIATGQDRNVSLDWRKSPFDISCLSPLVSPFDILCLLLTYCVSFWHYVRTADSPTGASQTMMELKDVLSQVQAQQLWCQQSIALILASGLPMCIHVCMYIIAICGVNSPLSSSLHPVFISVYVCIRIYAYSYQYVVSTVYSCASSNMGYICTRTYFVTGQIGLQM